MKNALYSTLIATILSLVFTSAGSSQISCLPGGITFTTQEEIDNFSLNYPGCTEILGDIRLIGAAITNVDSLYLINTVSGFLYISGTELVDLEGFSNWQIRNSLYLISNKNLVDLKGLESITNHIPGYLYINDNKNLEDISTLSNNFKISGGAIINNTALNKCSIEIICLFISEHCIGQNPCPFLIENNGSECISVEYVLEQCNDLMQWIFPKIEIDYSEICNGTDIFEYDVSAIAKYYSTEFEISRLFDISMGQLNFSPFLFYLTLPQFNSSSWNLCSDTIWVDPTQYGDTIIVSFRLDPLKICPELTVDLGLPPTFRGCLVSSDMRVRTQNTGTIPAANVELAVVIPFELMEVESAVPPPVAQSGDTLFFALGDLDIFQVADVHLTVRTRCDTFLLGHTICIEAFAEMDNPCPPDLPLGSRVQVRASCQNDEKVVFTLTNTGDAPTDVPHHYFIIEDEVVLLSDEFHLNVLESIQVEVDASGATMRMEATKLPNGMLTAAALEGCGGFTPGMINAFWLDRGESHYDIACRPVILAYDPNDKLAIPSGVGPAHLLAPNRPIEYIIRFQNTGTDTAFRVLLTDILPPELDVNTFRPGYASHDYTWEIRGLDSLDVLFFPIALPDSAASQEGSQGFFTFSMDQKPNLPDGTLIRNTASIIFDFNPPIVTNTVFHTIGTLSVHLDPPQHQGMVWLLHGNPTRDQAIFRAPVSMPGVKRFELYDLMGRGLRQEHFDGDEFLFQRGGLRSGMYLFRITDDRGRQFTGKIVIAE